MPDIKYKLFINDEAADQDRLDSIEEIVVEQEVDMAWEARIKMPLCVDERGMWSDEDEQLLESFTRVRVAIQIGEEPFVPLIDGPVVGYNNVKSSNPGDSTVTINVHDDSVYLNRSVQIQRFEGLSDGEIASQLFSTVEGTSLTPDIDEDDIADPAEELRADVIQRATAITLLRRLARCQGMHAYVLPGDDPGQSIGCFKKFATEPDTDEGLPEMTLLGKDQNITSFNLSNNGQGATQAQTFSIGISDLGTVSGTSSFQDLPLLGPQESTQEDQAATSVERPGGLCRRVPAEHRSQARTERDSYTLQATGEILENCYEGVLRPYLVVPVKAVNGRESGNYLIKKVTHTLSRSSYQQSFTLISNALSEGAETGVSDLVGSII